MKTPVKSDPNEAFVDLIYVLEVSVSSGLIDEDVIVPIFQRLCGLKKKTGQDVLEEMDGIRQELAMMLPASHFSE